MIHKKYEKKRETANNIVASIAGATTKTGAALQRFRTSS